MTACCHAIVASPSGNLTLRQSIRPLSRRWLRIAASRGRRRERGARPAGVRSAAAPGSHQALRRLDDLVGNETQLLIDALIRRRRPEALESEHHAVAAD